MTEDWEMISQKMEEEFAVRERKSIYGVGAIIFGMGFFLLLAELMFHTGPAVPLWVYLIVAMILACAGGCIMIVRNRKLEVKTSEITYTDMFGHRKKFTLGDIGYVKASANAARGRDFFHILDRNGKMLCKLEFHMENAYLLLRYFYDNGVEIEAEKEPGDVISQILSQERIPREDLGKLSEEICTEAGSILTKWLETHPLLEADFYYGLSEYHADRLRSDCCLQPPDSRCTAMNEKELPGDYMCMLEIYLKKEGLFILDRKKNPVGMRYPVIYRQRSAAEGEAYQLCYNRYFIKDIPVMLKALEQYLPNRRFIQEEQLFGYELKRKLAE